MTDKGQKKFWDRLADRYAARPIKDVDAYEAMLMATARHLKPSDTVLELGCGTGGTAFRLSQHVDHWEATDFSSRMIEIAESSYARDNLDFVVIDADSAFEGKPFDAICAFNVVHLVENPPTTLAKIYNGLKPGGLFISKTWCFADLRLRGRILVRLLTLLRLFPNATSFTAITLKEAIEGAGFEIVEEAIFGKFRQNPCIVARKPAA